MREHIRFGIIGLGLIGRELASAAARWMNLTEVDFQPKIVAVSDVDPSRRAWFIDHVPGIEDAYEDYRDLLARGDIDAVYVAVPHHLHRDIYCDVLTAGKHLLGEKPLGIDAAANADIVRTAAQHPNLLVRCSSEFPFYPGAWRVVQAVLRGDLGNVFEVRASFGHSGDLDPEKPINWKRRVATNGEYGCMGDLGPHVLHIPLRLGWEPNSVYAMLSNIVRSRPDGAGGVERCDTWDNATLACIIAPNQSMLLETKRISPGDTNTWSIEIYGSEGSIRFSTREPKTLRTLHFSPGREQAWETVDLGYAAVYPTITGGIVEFGFSDALLQMFAAFCDEIVHGDRMIGDFKCLTLDETTAAHRVFTAALASHEAGSAIDVLPGLG